MNEIEQKEIEEMARYIVRVAGIDVYGKAEYLLNAGYRNVKDKVVLDKEELAKYLKVNIELAVCQKAVSFLTSELNDYKQRYESAEKRYEQLVQSSCEALAKKSKETARDFYHEIMSYIGANQKFWIVDDEHITIINVDELFDFVIELAKQYGVEVE